MDLVTVNIMELKHLSIFDIYTAGFDHILRLIFSAFSVVAVSCSVEYASVCYAMRVDYETVSPETVLSFTYVSL